MDNFQNGSNLKPMLPKYGSVSLRIQTLIALSSDSVSFTCFDIKRELTGFAILNG
jgi:hypothetical protein